MTVIGWQPERQHYADCIIMIANRDGQVGLNSVAAQLKKRIIMAVVLKKWLKQSRNTKQRFNILKEWIATQHSYIQDLKTIEQNIQKPLTEAKLITPEEEKILFPNLKAMIDLSLDLTLCLEGALKVWHPHQVLIGDSIKAYSKFFMIYREYCNNFMRGQQVIKQLKKLPQTIKIEQKLRLDIESYVIKPVQRPPKYQLLLRQYHKALPKTHKDYAKIEQATEKYQEVNELNNESMDKQIRVQAMIKLDKLYGGVISSRFGRQYMKVFFCSCLDIKCQLHCFSDMLLLLRNAGNDNQQLWKRIMMDHTSFIYRKPDLKHARNMVLVCGASQATHFKFHSPADLNRFIENANSIIGQLRIKEEDKRQRYLEQDTRKNNIAKIKVSKWCENIYFNIKHKAKLEIYVNGTLRPFGEPFFFTTFRIIKPYRLHQTLLLTRGIMQEVQAYLLTKYRNLNVSSITEGSEAIGFYNLTKSKTEIIQGKSFQYEEALNYIFRNQQFYDSWKDVAQIIGLNMSFFGFASSENLNCKCSLCIELKANASLRYYIDQLRQLRSQKKVVRSRLMWVNEGAAPSKASYISQNGKDLILSKTVCSSQYFQIMQNIRKCVFKPDACIYDRVASLQARMGHFDYLLLEPEEKVDKLSKPVNLRIKILSVEEQYIDIKLKEDRYVRSLIDQIGAKNRLQIIYDWGLFMLVDGHLIHIPPDERLLDYSQKWRVTLNYQEEVDQSQAFLVSRLKKIKQRIDHSLFRKDQGQLIFMKWFYLEPTIQLEWCKGDPLRSKFLINLIYGRFKTGEVLLQLTQIIDLSALYLLNSQFERVKDYSTADDIQMDLLKELVPPIYEDTVKEASFRVELFLRLKFWWSELAYVENRSSVISHIHEKTLQLIKQNLDWLTRTFILSSYKGTKEKDVELGINLQLLTVRSRQTKQIMFSLDLMNLNYRLTTFSIVIESNYREYRYDGTEVLDIKELIELYRVYRVMTGARVSNLTTSID